MSTPTVAVVTIDSILAAVKAKAPRERHADLKVFCRAFYARVPAEELELRDAATWASIAISNREFADQRSPGVAKIRVFNPGPNEGFGAGQSIVHGGAHRQPCSC